MNQLRVFGEAFGDGCDGQALRAFLGATQVAGVRCSLALAGIAPRPAGGDQQPVVLDDGWQSVVTATALPPAICAPLVELVTSEVAATAPVVVFAPPGQHAEAKLLASLAFPAACAVLVAGDGQLPHELLDRVRAEWRWAGVDQARHALPERTLRPWLTLPPAPTEASTIVHVASPRGADGTDLVLTAWRRHGGRHGARLRLVVAAADAAAVAALAADSSGVEIVVGPPSPAHVADAIGWLQPWRAAPSIAVVVEALASARAVVASRCGDLAAVLGGAATARSIDGTAAADGGFAPDPDEVFAGLLWLLDGRPEAAAIGRRARRRVVAEFVAGRCAPPPPPVVAAASKVPVVAVVAPWLAAEDQVAAEVALVRELVARGRVDVRLMLALPATGSVAALRAWHPELQARLCRQPGKVELWLAADAHAEGLPTAAPRQCWPTGRTPSVAWVEAQAFAAKFGVAVPGTVGADSAGGNIAPEPLFELPLASRALSPNPTVAR